MPTAGSESFRAALLHDVDGVLNPMRSSDRPRPARYAPQLLRPKVFPGVPASAVEVWIDPDHGRLLRELADATDAELVWATAWEHEAARLLALILELPPLDVEPHHTALAKDFLLR
ncbi:HAD domain-containing protein [Nocardia sp. NPDC058058]|uniref:HAD domain-containing protein n=1 Tax=Nocardia sp. NPDC058058 TaxID=3346317 RepID=UPI0036DEDF85